MVESTGTILQTIALSLPAVALYMTVLNELYVAVEKAEEPMSREMMGPMKFRPTPEIEPKEDNILRGFVTVTRAMNGLDFQLATVSLFLLVVSALLLVLHLAVTVVYIRWVGMMTAVGGFGVLALALAYTAFASVFQRYPESK